MMDAVTVRKHRWSLRHLCTHNLGLICGTNTNSAYKFPFTEWRRVLPSRSISSPAKESNCFLLVPSYEVGIDPDDCGAVSPGTDDSFCGVVGLFQTVKQYLPCRLHVPVPAISLFQLYD